MSSQLSAHAITAHTAMTRISVSRCSTLPAHRGSARAEKCSTSFSADIAPLPSLIKGEPAQPVSPSEPARPFHALPLGFARESLMSWCEHNRVDFVFGLARNSRLVEEIAVELIQAEDEAGRTGQPARRYKDFRWSTLDSWSRRRRVIAKAEWTGGEANPRFVVTSLKPSEVTALHLYEEVYCARGDMENRIKECQGDLFADRTSAATMRANQLRLWFASMAYVLICALRRIGLAHTQFAQATCGTIRLKLLKIGALVRTSVRRVTVAIASAFPHQSEFALAHVRLTTERR